jgi:hypothetical protein
MREMVGAGSRKGNGEDEEVDLIPPPLKLVF